MRIFLDTANVEQIRHGVRMGVVSGVTTNPTINAKEGNADYEALSKEICASVSGPVSVEGLVEGAESMLRQARQIHSWAENVVVKIPATAEGLEVTSLLSKEGIKVNMTLCFSLNQAILGALAGAAYVSPFVGRLDDIGTDGIQRLKEIVEVLKSYQLRTEVIAASIRHPMHCVAAAMAGAHIATVPYNVLLQMIQHPMTTAGISRFLADWQKVAKK